MQFYLDHGYAYVAFDIPGTGRSEENWDPVSRAEGEAIHDMIEHADTYYHNADHPSCLRAARAPAQAT